MILCIDNVLTSNELDFIVSKLKDAEFIDGKDTAGWHAKLDKNNMQLPNGALTQEMRGVVTQALKRNHLFQATVRPKIIQPIIFSCYEPGMSGFVSELQVFVGVTTSDVYSPTFRTVMVFLAAVGVILTPIYLLSMLKQVYYGTGKITCDVNNAGLENQEDEGTACFGTDCLLPNESVYSDTRPREMFIAACFLVLIIGIGVYPKLATQLYDTKTVAVNTQVRQSYVQIAQENPRIYAKEFISPHIGEPEIATVSSIVK